MLNFLKLSAAFFLMALLAWSCSSSPDSDLISGTQLSPNGFQYIIHTDVGGPKPQVSDIVYFSAHIRNADSVVFSTNNQGSLPYTPILDEVASAKDPSPVADVVQLLAVGDSATVYLRIDTFPNIPPGFENEKFMIYDLVVKKILSQASFQEEQQAMEAERQERIAETKARQAQVEAELKTRTEDYMKGKLNSQIKETTSGLKLLVHNQGDGPKADAGDFITVHYHGMLTDGSTFDSSFERGEPINFTVGAGQMIAGWDEGLLELNQGGSMTLFIPAALGYGAEAVGTIPANSELVFYVELVDVQKQN